MSIIECSREEDVLAAVSTGRWPNRADAELRAHVAQCAVCQDVVAVVSAFAEEANQNDHAHQMAAAPALPDATAVWLKSQIRARAEALRTAGRPISVAQAVAFAAVVGVLGALVGASSSWLQAGWHWTTAAVSQFDPWGLPVPTGIWTLVAEHAFIATGIVAAVVVVLGSTFWVLGSADRS